MPLRIISTPERFQPVQLFGLSHLGVLASTAVAIAALIYVARTQAPQFRSSVAWILALVLGLNKTAVLLHASASGGLTLANALPMHLCDWTTVVAVLALVTGGRLACELAWFWGLAGTAQAILTPDLYYDFPDFEFLSFFISHSGVVAAGVYAPLHWRHPMTWASAGRAFIWLQGYAIAAIGVNLLVGANYGYLMAKPARASLLDLLGPWPWYILAIEGIALLSFFILRGIWLLLERTNTSIRHIPAA